MTAIIKRLLALATAFTLALNLVGCGGQCYKRFTKFARHH